MSIQWFPGHMAKARRQVEEKLKMVDVVYELVDGRLPLSSRNPMMDEIIRNKPRLILLTKCDLADEAGNAKWIQYFQQRGHTVLPVDAQTGKGVKQIHGITEKLLQPMFEKRAMKGIQSKKMRAMVIGIPNVGKSSLINRLANRSATVTGDRPGVTKAQQWIRLGNHLELLDTPGILWPKFDDQETGFKLAASGAIKEEILATDEIALYMIHFLKKHYPQALAKRYQIADVESYEDVALMEEMGRKRGCLQRGGVINYEKVAEIFLNDLRGGRIGRITYELPEDWMESEDEK
ncbi:ribosome biogenesis GTPase YlqF [Hazenella sp. IB182357]|uniref:Ribosome biogenesis GTPase A n=1 Tax=Polycladospora coralii TaxID=2771432 RepID=A0A926N5Z6_9BACL|nr:ribosome biogenesis GTPase YlqF [Polycladospora coralii]MBD1371426.1 ribosome biogenesis GTPase YlqF [Polycladospora coralii]MBS7530394.1 ribosome biogenesis GTPase YlqF [Polycladospora coralii]